MSILEKSLSEPGDCYILEKTLSENVDCYILEKILIETHTRENLD